MRTAKDYKQQFENITEKDITVFENLEVTPEKKVQAENYVVMLCTDGRAHCELEGKVVNVGKNDILLCHPNVFVDNVMVNMNFKCQGMIMSPTYFETIFYVDGNFLDIGMSIIKNPVIHLEDKEVENFLFNFSVLKKKLAQTELEHHAQIVKHLLQSLLFEFYDYLSPHLQLKEISYNFSSAEVIFKRFTQMLSHECPKRRDVKHYADELCITPKYLSAISKRQCSKTASELINSIAVNYIKNMLTSSDRSIKEIATESGFDNLSFFGKYVKRELGMSPRQFRAQKKQ